MFYHVKDLQFNARVTESDSQVCNLVAWAIRGSKWRTCSCYALLLPREKFPGVITKNSKVS